MNEVTWDYSELAAHYDKRADYADAAIDAVIALAKPSVNRPLADIGAGTAKLTRPLLARGFTVHAVEPNDEMREVGRKNTEGQAVTWSVGTGEATGLEDAAYDLVTFGSSFNVTDRAATLTECARILRPRG
jgi:ubiquinone/menaquinone biosynthesis C-methylase UbiE